MRARWQLAPVALALLIGATAAAGEWPRREILATGDTVPSLGRVGRFSAHLRGIDDRGRLLVAADLSDGSGQLYWADESGLEALLPNGTFQPRSAVASPGGRVAVRVAGVRDRGAIYVLSGGDARRVLGSGDVVGPQLEVQGLSEPLAIADDGTVVASATLHRLDAPIDAPPQYALLAAGPTGLRIVAGNGADLDDAQRFDGSNLVGVTADGVVVFNGMRGEAPPVVYAADASGVRKLVGPGTPAPSGTPFRELRGLAVSPNGELLLRGCRPSAAEYPRRQDCAIYRTLDGRLVRVAGPSQRTDDGLHFEAVEGSLNARGDVLLRATLLPRCNDGSPGLCDGGYALLLLPAGGAVETVHRGYETGYLNGGGAVASFDTPGLVRWQAGVAQPILTPDTAAPSGAAFLDQGLDNGSFSAQCIAADGRVGAFVVTTGGGASFVCADADGLHVIVREGDAPFRDSGYWPSIQCAFADGEAMFVGTSEGVFRASTATGLERVIGNGDALPDGEAIRAR